jgi:hypothetical protein
MTSPTHAFAGGAGHDLAIVRALAAVLEDAIRRADHETARALAEQLAGELERQGVRWSPR